MSHRPLVFVSGLTVGDYLLWNWSLNGGQDVLALVAGLTLPPLAVACLWLLALSLARLLARRARRPATASRREAAGRQTARGPAQTSTAGPVEEAGASARTPGRSSGRLAA